MEKSNTTEPEDGALPKIDEGVEDALGEVEDSIAAVDPIPTNLRDLTIGMLFSRLKIAQAWGVLVALSGLLIAVFLVGRWSKFIESPAPVVTGAPVVAASAIAGVIRETSETMDTSSAESAALDPVDGIPQLAQLRESNAVRRLLATEDGLPFDEIPPGRFGFCGSPHVRFEGFQCYVYRDFNSFSGYPEIHKTSDGEGSIVVFASEERAIEVRTASSTKGVFYQRPTRRATELLEIPMQNITFFRSRSTREDGELIQMFDIETQEVPTAQPHPR